MLWGCREAGSPHRPPSLLASTLLPGSPPERAHASQPHTRRRRAPAHSTARPFNFTALSRFLLPNPSVFLAVLAFFPRRASHPPGATVCPVAIKYNKIFVDAFWNSKRQSFSAHLVGGVCAGPLDSCGIGWQLRHWLAAAVVLVLVVLVLVAVVTLLCSCCCLAPASAAALLVLLLPLSAAAPAADATARPMLLLTPTPTPHPPPPPMPPAADEADAQLGAGVRRVLPGTAGTAPHRTAAVPRRVFLCRSLGPCLAGGGQPLAGLPSPYTPSHACAHPHPQSPRRRGAPARPRSSLRSGCRWGAAGRVRGSPASG